MSSPTPWHIGYNFDTCDPPRWPGIDDARNVPVIYPGSEIEAKMLHPVLDHIVACVNACEGKTDEELKDMCLRRISCCIIVRRGDETLFQFKLKHNQWELPGGKLKGTETALDCAKRELEEETGIRWLEGRQLGYVDHGDKYGCVVFECTKWEGTPAVMEPDKQSVIGWFKTPPENLTEATKVTLEAFTLR